MKRFVYAIDSMNRYIGLTIRWLVVVMILSTTWEVFVRYVFGKPTVWAHQLVMITGGLMVVLGWGYVHFLRGHVAIDLLYDRLSPRGRAIMDVACACLFFFPMTIILIYISHNWLQMSIVQGEVWDVSFWRPLMWPSRLAVLVGVLLIMLQGFAHLLRDVYFLRRGEKL